MPGRASWLMACDGILVGDIPEGSRPARKAGVIKKIKLCFMMLEADTTKYLVWIGYRIW